MSAIDQKGRKTVGYAVDTWFYLDEERDEFIDLPEWMVPMIEVIGMFGQMPYGYLPEGFEP